MASCAADFEKKNSDSISSEKPNNMNPENPKSGAIDPTSTSKTTSPASGFPIFPTVEGTPDTNDKVNDEHTVPVEGINPDLVNAFLKTAIRTENSSSHSLSKLDRAEILAIATQITENIIKYSAKTVISGAPTSKSGEGISRSVEKGSEEPLVVAASGRSDAPSAHSEGEIEVANPDGVLTNPIAPIPPVITDSSELSVVPTVSFRQADKMGVDPSAPVLSYSEATAGNSDGVLGSVDFSSGTPTVIFTKIECEQVSSYYRFALIGKFSYGKPPNHSISQQLKSDGFGYPMSLFRWDPFFNFKEEPASAPLWVKIHSLPSHWFDLRSLKTIASSLGEFLKVDESTHNRTRLNFARVCVEVNLKNYLPQKINLQVGDDIVELDIEFEKVPQYCQYCKHIGHDITMCYIKDPGLKPAVFTTKNFTKQPTDSTVSDGFRNQGISKQATAPGGAFQNLDDGFQLVGKRGRHVGSSGTKTVNASTSISNSFHTLTEDEEGLDGKNLESGSKDNCPLDNEPAANFHNSSTAALGSEEDVFKKSQDPILVDVVILEEGSDVLVKPTENFSSAATDFIKDPPAFANSGQVGEDTAVSKTNIMDVTSDCSSEYSEGSDNYKSDFNDFSKDDSLLDQSLSDHSAAEFKLAGTGKIPFRDKLKITATNVNNGRKKTLKNAHETSNILDKRTRSGVTLNDYFLRDLWDDLLSVSQNQVPWMVGGDFNIILQPEEKKGGAVPIHSDIEEFNDCLLNCKLHDGGYTGTPFTWYRAGV
ncbi:hypothetical protein OROMI_031418 [Orobanche minor]